MRDVERSALRAAIELLHGCAAVFHSDEDVSVILPGRSIWRRRVATYDLDGHPTARRCYAWIDQHTDEQKVHHRVVLHCGVVLCARDAVSAFFLAASPAGLIG